MINPPFINVNYQGGITKVYLVTITEGVGIVPDEWKGAYVYIKRTEATPNLYTNVTGYLLGQDDQVSLDLNYNEIHRFCFKEFSSVGDGIIYLVL